jgi:hypothetical protein
MNFHYGVLFLLRDVFCFRCHCFCVSGEEAIQGSGMLLVANAI